jgi:hypothetical protein
MSPLITMLIHVYSAGKSKAGLCGSDTHLHSLEGMFGNPVVAYVRDMYVTLETLSSATRGPFTYLEAQSEA